jgi:tetratricopeptide (TPR) repeat protein
VVLETFHALLGDAHISTALAYANLGQDLVLLGRPAEALPLLEKAMEAKRALFPPAHPSFRTTALTLAEAEVGVGRFADAARELEIALPADKQRKLGPLEIEALNYVGLDQLGLGHPADAVATLARALDATADGSIPDDRVAALQIALARALRARGGDEARALELVRAARTSYGDKEGPMYDRLRAEADALVK